MSYHDDNEISEGLSEHLQTTVEGLNNSKELFLYKLPEKNFHQENEGLKKTVWDEIVKNRAELIEWVLFVAKKTTEARMWDGETIAALKMNTSELTF
jgi:hypothetical protein